MPIQPEGEFLVTRSLGITPSIGIESSRLSACLTKAKAYFKGVFGSPSFDFRESNLDFLTDLPDLKQVWFWDCDFKSISGLYALANLEYCGVMDKHPGIDYSRFPRLHTVIAYWNPKDSGIAASQIRKFHLWHFKPRDKRFNGISLPSSVEELELNWVNPTSLDGLPVLPHLMTMGIHRSRNMMDLLQLPAIAPRLKKLIVTSSNRVNDVSGIEDHPTIELAIINGRRIRG